MSSREPSGATSSNSIVFSDELAATTAPVIATSSILMDDAKPSFTSFDSIQSLGDGQGLGSDRSLGPLGGMTDNGNGINDDDFPYVGEPFLNCDLDSAPAFDRESCNLDNILAKWPTKVADCLIPSRNSDNDCSAFYPPQTKGPLLASLMAIFTVWTIPI